MNRRGFLRALFATAAMATGLARTSVEAVIDGDALTLEKLRNAKRVLTSQVINDDYYSFVVPRCLAKHFGLSDSEMTDIRAAQIVERLA